MSIPSSKSKTQLAYARSTKAVNKPKGKNVTQTEQSDLNKSRSPARNSTGNIYQSLMGQIDPKQQNYIKTLIVKNEKETLKTQKQSQKQLTKMGKQQVQEIKKSTLKAPKQLTLSQKGSLSSLHQSTTKSQTDLLNTSSQQQPQIQTEKFIKIQSQKRNPQTRYQSEQQSIGSSQVMGEKESSRKEHNLTAFPQTMASTNPIIQALNNTSGSFVKRLQAFQIQYPTEERQQRGTHKKVQSKLIGEYYSCQASPKNSAKNSYANDMIVTIKPTQSYYNSGSKNDRQQSTKTKPLSAGKASNVKSSNQKKLLNSNEQEQTVVNANFLSCLDNYLQALAINPNNNEQNSKPCAYSMKRHSSNKMRQFPTTTKTTLPHTFAFDKQDQQQQTVVLQTLNYQTALTNNKLNQPKHLSLTQQQKLLKSLQKEKKKVSQLKSIMELFNQQLTKYKKKEKKMRENQYHMIECLKTLNQELTEEKKQRRKLEEVVKDFQAKIQGINRGREKKRRLSMVQEQDLVERQSIYGASSLVNNINYPQQLGNFYYQQDDLAVKETPLRGDRQKKGSKKRYPSVINSMTQEYSRNVGGEEQYDGYYQEKRQLEDGFSKNRTQKVTKIISTFDLDDQLNDDQVRYSHVRNSNRNNPPPTSKASFLNSSLPKQKHLKSTPLTPRVIQQLFTNSKKSSKKNPAQKFFNQQRIQVNNFQTESEEQSYRQARHYDQEENIQGSSDEDQLFNPTTINSSRSNSFEERNDREYNGQQNDVLIRMR